MVPAVVASVHEKSAKSKTKFLHSLSDTHATSDTIRAGVGQVIAAGIGFGILSERFIRGGKSGLHRTRRQVMPGGREPTESAAESRPPKLPSMLALRVAGKGERVW